MNATNMPGFTADQSLYGSNGQAYARVSDASYGSGAEIVPQGCYVIDGQFWCDLPRFPFPKPDPEIRCRSACRRRFRGPELAACLAEC